MLNGISWGEYALIAMLSLTAYYTAIGLWFYMHNLKTSPLGIKTTFETVTNENEHKNIPPTSFAETSDEDFQKVEALMRNLKDVIAGVFYHHQGRKVLLQKLSRILKKHPELINTPFGEGIREFIISECNKYGPVNLSADELKGMWSVGA